MFAVLLAQVLQRKPRLNFDIDDLVQNNMLIFCLFYKNEGDMSLV